MVTGLKLQSWICTTRMFITVPMLLCAQMLSAQVFSGWKSFETLIEYEGQRFLMDNVYEVSSTNADTLIVEKLIKEVDSDEGFMFVLMAYKYNDNYGVVITTFSAQNFEKSIHKYRNVHLSYLQLSELNSKFEELAKQISQTHVQLYRFNESMILETGDEGFGPYYRLWTHSESRHTFSDNKWQKAMGQFEKFMDEN